MKNRDLVPAKATTSADKSDAIVVSFSADWHHHLLSKDFSVVIRKRVPKENSFIWLYFHINSPVGAICARAPIDKVFQASPKEAVALAKEINLSPTEIISYIGEADSVGCYKLGVFQFAAKPVSKAELANQLVYHPPQSFFVISKRAKEIVDQLAQFGTPKSTRPRTGGNL